VDKNSPGPVKLRDGDGMRFEGFPRGPVPTCAIYTLHYAVVRVLPGQCYPDHGLYFALTVKLLLNSGGFSLAIHFLGFRTRFDYGLSHPFLEPPRSARCKDSISTDCEDLIWPPLSSVHCMEAPSLDSLLKFRSGHPSTSCHPCGPSSYVT